MRSLRCRPTKLKSPPSLSRKSSSRWIRGFQLGFRVFVLEFQEFQHIGILTASSGNTVSSLAGIAPFSSIAALFRDKCRTPAKLATDMAIKLAHAPTSAQSLRFTELAGVTVPDREQANISRPRQCEKRRQLLKSLWPSWIGKTDLGCGTCVRRLPPGGGFLRQQSGRFARHRLANWPSEKEQAHLLQVLTAAPSAELPYQVQRKPLDQLLAIARSPPAFLLGLEDAATEHPIARRRQ